MDLTVAQVGGPEEGVDLGGEEVDEGHGHEHKGEAEDAPAQGHKDHRRVEDEVREGPKGHGAQLGQLINIGDKKIRLERDRLARLKLS